MKLYAVYTQWHPSYKYEPTLESIWADKDKALEAARTFKSMDYVWVETIVANHGNISGYDLGEDLSLETVTVYKPNDNRNE